MSSPNVPSEGFEFAGLGTVVYRDNDLGNSPNEQFWHEVEIRGQGDGLLVDARQMSQGSGDVSGEAVTTRDGYAYEQNRNFMDLQGVADTQEPLRSVADAVGIHVRRIDSDEGEHYQGYVPGFSELKNRFDFVREQTGYAPDLEQFDGVEFDHDTMAQKEIDDVVLVSEDPPTHGHDVLAHAWVRLALTEDMNGAIGARTRVLRDAALRHASDPDSPAALRSQADLTRHLDYLDKTMNARPIVGIAGMIEGSLAGDSAARAKLAKTLKILTGNSDDESIQAGIDGIGARVDEISRLSESSEGSHVSETSQVSEGDAIRGGRVAAAFGRAVGSRTSRQKHGIPRRSGHDRRLDPHRGNNQQ